MNYTEKNKLVDNLCGIGLMLIFMEVFFAIAYEIFNSIRLIAYWDVIFYGLGAIFLIISIVLLTFAYRKENGNQAFYGLEFLFLAFATGFLYPCGVLIKDPIVSPITLLQSVLPLGVLGYYFIKVVVVLVRAKKKR